MVHYLIEHICYQLLVIHGDLFSGVERSEACSVADSLEHLQSFEAIQLLLEYFRSIFDTFEGLLFKLEWVIVCFICDKIYRQPIKFVANFLSTVKVHVVHGVFWDGLNGFLGDCVVQHRLVSNQLP